jgi:hypothetical protein
VAGTTEDDSKAGARLFVVSIGRKRTRDESYNGGDTGDVKDPVSRGAAEVEAEPVDAPLPPNHHQQQQHPQQAWLFEWVPQIRSGGEIPSIEGM